MGRNSIPKLSEWRDGKLYEFVAKGDGGDPNSPTPGDGRLIVYQATTMDRSGNRETTILATCFADGFEECLAAMFSNGCAKGEKVGYERARAEMRAAMGLNPA